MLRWWRMQAWLTCKYDQQKSCETKTTFEKTLNVSRFWRKHFLQESGGQVVLAGGTVVTLVNKANKCIRKVNEQSQR